MPPEKKTLLNRQHGINAGQQSKHNHVFQVIIYRHATLSQICVFSAFHEMEIHRYEKKLCVKKKRCMKETNLCWMLRRSLHTKALHSPDSPRTAYLLHYFVHSLAPQCFYCLLIIRLRGCGGTRRLKGPNTLHGLKSSLILIQLQESLRRGKKMRKMLKKMKRKEETSAKMKKNHI